MIRCDRGWYKYSNLGKVGEWGWGGVDGLLLL